MPHYTIDEHGNAKVIDEKNDEALADKLKKVSSMLFWTVVVMCIAVYLIFYIDVPITLNATQHLQNNLKSSLLTSSYFNNHLSNKWTTLVSDVESLWLTMKNKFLEFRQEVR